VAVEEYASATGMILDRLGVAKCITVGHSMGVQFALELGIQRPERVAGVVMIGPVVDPSRPTLA
jgi:pimeloyl-ACP methyl ester carboxylesterase